MLSSFKQQTPRKIIIVNLLVGFSYVAAAFLSYLLAFDTVIFPVFWFPVAVVFCSILILGLQIIPSIFLASFSVFLFIHVQYSDYSGEWQFLAALTLASIESVVAFLINFLIQKFDLKLSFFNDTKTSFRFSLICFLASLPVLAYAFWPDAFILQNQNIFTFWLSYFAALLMGSVFIISIYLNPKFDLSTSRFIEILILFGLTFLISQFIFDDWLGTEIINSLPYLVLPPLMWIAFRFDVRESLTAVFIINVLAIWATKNGTGPFARESVYVSILILQIYSAVIAFIGTILSVSINERRKIMEELQEISNSLEKRVAKRTSELATLNRELLVEVNQRERAESALKETQERNQALLSALPDLIFLQDKNGIYLDYQTPSDITLSTDPGVYLGKSMFEILPAEIANDLKTIFEVVLNTGETQSYEYKLSGRENFHYYEARISPCGDNKVLSVIREISERKKAEKALQESEDRLRFIFENANDALFTLNSQGNFFYISPAVEKLLGYIPAELFGDKLLKFVYPDDKRNVQKALEIVSSGQQKEIHIEYRVLNKSGEILWHSTSITRNIDASGNNLFVGVSKDITERIKAEQERLKLEEQVRHTQKLESLGVLAGGIAHDFNNLLTAIMGNTGLALMSQDSETKIKTNLINIEKASLRAADLCKQLLAYSGKGQFLVEPLNLNSIVKEMSDLLTVSISRKINLNYQFSDNIPAFEADSTQIRQIVMNLITNASEAIGDKVGTIDIATGIVSFTKDSLKDVFSDGDFQPGDYVFLDVTDSGSGMDEETKSKIFDPFFTTKFTGRGLGLAAVLGIVRSHKGGIVIKTNLNKGTTFRILFPISDKQYKQEYSEKREKMDWKAKGTILVVDDEEDIRNFVSESLEHAGLDVLTAFDGQNAIDVYKQNGKNINLILMDMTMPNLNGAETYRELKKIKPDIKVILSSGYSKEKAMEKFSNLSLCDFLQKPYKPSDLIKKIQSILGSNGSN